MRDYPAQCKADAVALYHSRPGVSVASVATDLGVSTETLRSWMRAPRPVAARPVPAGPASVETPVEEENRELRRQVAELKQEREILRRSR
ncbi:transposase [Streptacidiphilus sp. MAP12-16]|uniref:transposase n=1 Tax=Streptacidiphilus sp. MAP12-16 TaxID=3156300 RepID=UPI0035198E09